MNIQDKNRLRKNRCNLVDIDPDQIKHHLIQEELFTPQQMDELLMSQPTPKDRMGSLLTKMEEKGPNAYSVFRTVLLQFPSYKHLVDELDRTLVTVDLDEVDGQPVRQESSRTEGDVTGRGQGVTIIGDNNRAIVGGSNSNIVMH